MKRARFSLQGIGEYSQSRGYDRDFPKRPKENSADYEKRTWRGRCHVNSDGKVFIPPMAFKYGLTSASKYLGEQIPGKGKSTYTKHFESGILILDPITLPVIPDEVEGRWFFVPADGQRGGSKRVWKCFPVIEGWAGDLIVTILDETITRDVLRRHVIALGQYIGIGRFRPEKGGTSGRFRVVSDTWEEVNLNEGQ